MKEFEKAIRKGHKWQEEVTETKEELEQTMKKINKELEKDEPEIIRMVGKDNGKKYTGNSNNTNNKKASEGTNWFKSLWDANSKVISQIPEIKIDDR